ncbi:hypothetical protein GGR57DRAFT_194123 [Xylariaceae sp. FL1272]|nr:hypothetical protein GGR57DRAFT_194123 [Xylariaceae sp. FL1272]
MSADGHGLPDNAIRSAHDMMHHVEQEEHEHEAAARRGLPDEAAEAEYDLMHRAEEEQARVEKPHSAGHTTGSSTGSKFKKTMDKLIPDKLMPGKH